MPLTSTLEKTPPPLPGKTVDNTLPTVGGNLAVVSDSETSSGFSLSWDKGSDNQTAEENLKYLVYISDQDNITGVQNAENNGTLLNPDEEDQLDINSYQVIGQNTETQYWATVILKDQGGNKDAYGVVSTTTLAPAQSGLDSRAGDEAALEAIAGASSNLAEWADNTGWATSGMSLSDTIYGVTTASIDGELRVTEIDLVENNIVATLPSSGLGNLKKCTYFNVKANGYTGELPADIRDMVGCEWLLLNGRLEDPDKTSDHHPGKDAGQASGEERSNNFSGTLPSEWGDGLDSLEVLELMGNGFTGGFPSSWGNWSNLWGMFVAYNESMDEGGIPDNWQNLTSLIHLSMGHTIVGAGIHPIPAWLNNISTIEFLRVGRCHFAGDIPDLSNLDLVNFSMDENKDVDSPTGSDLTGSLEWMSGVTYSRLITLRANRQSFSGPLPYNESIANCTVYDFYVHANTGDIVPINEFNSVFIFRVAHGPVAGTLPQTGYSFPGGFRSVTLWGSNVTGNIPSDMINAYDTGMDDYDYFRLQDCEFTSFDIENVTASVPAGTVHVASNRLTPKDLCLSDGTIPSFLGSYTGQRAFDTFDDISVGDVIDFSEYDHPGNTYQWFLDGSPISGETGLTINTGDYGAGEYHMEIEHSSFTQTFESAIKTAE